MCENFRIIKGMMWHTVANLYIIHRTDYRPTFTNMATVRNLKVKCGIFNVVGHCTGGEINIQLDHQLG